MIFDKKVERSIEKNREINEAPNEEEFRREISDEMEDNDLLAMILGGFRFFAPLFIVLILILVVLSFFMK